MKTARLFLWAITAGAGLMLGVLLYAGLFDKDGTLAGDEPFGAPFSLVNHAGEPVTEKIFQGKPTALMFGFTNCPDVCPTTLYELTQWGSALGDRQRDLNVVFVTVDPERDTADILKNYVTAFSDDFVGVTGPVKDVHAMLKDFSVYYRKVPLEDGDYTMDHTASVFLLDENGGFSGTIAYGESTKNAITKLERK